MMTSPATMNCYDDVITDDDELLLEINLSLLSSVDFESTRFGDETTMFFCDD